MKKRSAKRTPQKSKKAPVTAPFSVSAIVQVTIERLAYGGAGVGRVNNFVMFVDFTAPGDLIEARVTEVKAHFARGELIRVVTPGPSRRLALCPVFGTCGGCQWQHVSYDEQLRQKLAAVQFAFRRLNTTDEAICIHPVLASPSEWRYRNRIQLHLAPGEVGFFARHSHKIVSILDCPITEEPLTQELNPLREKSLKNPSLKKVELHLTPFGQVVSSTQGGHGEELGFSQVNTKQNIQMIELLLTLLEDCCPLSLLDLYAGHGNLTFPLSQKFSDIPIEAVELNENAVRQAQAKAKIAATHRNIQFRCEDVESFLRKKPVHDRLVVIADPPRAGSSPTTLHELARLHPERLVYIGCDLNHLVRDLSIFLAAAEKYGTPYKIRSVHPVDMFPQTFHIETLVLLEPR